MDYFRIAATLAVVGTLLLGGWTVNSWRNGAARAEALEALNVKEGKARIRAEALASSVANERDAARRRIVELELTQSEGKIRADVKEAIRTVIVHVPDRRDCDLNAGVVRMLNAARNTPVVLPDPAGDLAPAPAPVAAPAGEAPKPG